MNTSELAEIIAVQLSERNFRLERYRVLGDSSYGIQTEAMLVVRIYFPLAPHNDGDLFQISQSLFPRIEGENLSLDSLSADGELAVCVYFPLPYQSAERFPASQRSEFIVNMALFKVSKIVGELLGEYHKNALPPALPDPRHPDEIKWENGKSAVIAFFKDLLPGRKKVPKRGFQEYL